MSGKPKIEIWFELENKCNLSCKFCYNYWKDGKFSPPEQLSSTDLITCFENLLTVAAPSKITLSGGEPLLRKDIDKLLTYLSTLKVPLILTTNGLLLNERKIANLISKGVVTFEVPLHSSNPEIHDFLSGANCFNESLDTIITLKSKDTNVVPVFVASSINLYQFNDVLKICKHLKLSDIIFNRVIPSGLAAVNKKSIGIPTDIELCDVLESSCSFAKSNNIRIHLGVPIKLTEVLLKYSEHIISASCPVQLSQKRWTIDSGGNIRRCNHSNLSVGNLLKGGHVNLRDLLESSTHECNNSFHHCQFIDKATSYEVSVI